MCTHNIPFFKEKRKSIQIILNLQLGDLFLGSEERVRNSGGKRAISVRAIEVLLYIVLISISKDTNGSKMPVCSSPLTCTLKVLWA